MPLYSFTCDSCAGEVEEFAPIGGPFPKCSCGGQLLKQIGVPLVVIPEYMKAVNSTYVSNHEKWFHSEETQKKLKTGELEVVKKGDR